MTHARAAISYRSERKTLWRKMNKTRPKGADPISWEDFNKSIKEEMTTSGYFATKAGKIARQAKIMETISNEKRNSRL